MPSTYSRNLYLDFLRGLFVCVMTINHLAFGQTWLEYLTGGGRLWFSAAEGFVLVSGIVFGLVYPRFLHEHGWKRTIGKVLKRSIQLYFIAVIWQILAAILAYKFNWGMEIGETFRQAIQLAFLQTGDIINQMDLLPMYSLLLLWGLFLLYLLENRKLIWVLMLSFAIWYIRLSDPSIFSFYELNFNPASWQILFALGLLGGYYQKQLHRWQAKLPGPGWVWILTLWMTSAGLWILSWAVVFRDFAPTKSWFVIEDIFFGKLLLKPGQILVSVLIFISLYVATKRFWNFLEKGLGWLLLPLGENSLIAYTIQATLGYAKLFLPGFPFPDLHNAWRCLMQVLGLIFTWLMTKSFVALKTILTENNRGFRNV